MKYPTLDNRHIEPLVDWMSRAFDSYASLESHFYVEDLAGETDDQRRIRMNRYKEEFQRILRGDAEVTEDINPKATTDLHDLKERGCAALDIVELMLQCTSGAGLSLSDSLQWSGVAEDRLCYLKQHLDWMPDAIENLTKWGFGGPHGFIRERFPKECEQQFVEQLITILPTALRYLAKLMQDYPPPSLCDSMAVAFANNFILTYFYLLLNHYGRLRCGF